jgi:hypothetical protein
MVKVFVLLITTDKMAGKLTLTNGITVSNFAAALRAQGLFGLWNTVWVVPLTTTIKAFTTNFQIEAILEFGIRTLPLIGAAGTTTTTTFPKLLTK